MRRKFFDGRSFANTYKYIEWVVSFNVVSFTVANQWGTFLQFVYDSIERMLAFV